MTTKRKPGRPVGPEGKRVRIDGRDVLVAPSSEMFLHACRSAYGVPIGRTIDALIAFARRKPDFRLPLTGRRPTLQTFNQPKKD